MSLLIVLIEGRFAGKIKIVLNHYVVADVFFLFFIKLPSQPLVCTRGGQSTPLVAQLLKSAC